MTSSKAPKGPYRTVPIGDRSEIGKFADFFHQDSDLIFPDFRSGARMYFESLSADQKLILKRELKQFVESRASPSSLKKAWFKLGAQWWQKDLKIDNAIRDIIDVL